MSTILEQLPPDLSRVSDEELQRLLSGVLHLQATERQQNQLRYYQPVSPKAASIHACTKTTIGIGGGNGASKTDTALVEMVIRATGQIPLSLHDTYPREKLRGPIACRMVCESLTTTLVPIILPKLQYWHWSGVDQAGGQRGHYGWIPKHCLVGGDWKKAWRERERMLRVLYRDPDHPENVIGESIIQFMSYDQDPSDFASGDFHFVLHDEPPKYDIWRENRARVMRVNGTMMLAMTWPDDPAIPVDWIFDELYEKAQLGGEHDDAIEWVNLYTPDNPNLNQSAVSERAKQMSATERATRIYGQPIRLGNRVHPLFTDVTHYWCPVCKEAVIRDESGECGTCRNAVLAFCHVQPCVAQSGWPILYALDPHPRKPHMMVWAAVTPNDDLQILRELEVDGGPAAVWEAVEQVEKEPEWRNVRRLMDPNMGRSPSDTNREATWQDAFERVGLICDLADDGEVGRRLVDDYLEPDPSTCAPRLLVDPRCQQVSYQMRRYLWSDFKRGTERNQKQRPKDKHDDYPTLLKYIVNSHPTFRSLKAVGQVYRREGRSAVGY